MQRLGHILNNDILRRYDAALDVYDNAAPPLKQKYIDRKTKSKYHGAPIRDLLLTGQLRRSQTVLSAAQNTTTIGFTNARAQEKMKFNQRRSRQYGVSPQNLNVLVKSVNEVIHSGKIMQVKAG